MDNDASLAVLVQKMPQKERAEYISYGALTLESVFSNRRMIVYRCHDTGPQDVEQFVVGDPEMPLLGEFQFPIETVRGVQMLGYVPTKLRNRELFLHVPQHFELRWSAKPAPSGGYHFGPHFAILIKSKSKEEFQIEGHTYCVTFNRFKSRFPNFDIRY